MPTYNKFNAWAEYMTEGANLGSDQFAVALTNTAPSASNSVIADITQISYTGLSSRNITTTSSSQTAGAYSLVFANLTLTATASVGPFRYIVIYDDTLASDPLVGWYDLGASMSLGASESLVLQGMGLDMAGVFTPLSLFSGGEQGGWYDPSDLSTLWQNSTRTTPVTADGDPVGAIDDKSGNGNHLIQATTSLKPLYKTSGGLHWLEFDGVDDRLTSTASINFTSTDKMSTFIGVRKGADVLDMIFELSPQFDTNDGSFALYTFTDAKFYSGAKGTVLSNPSTAAITAPATRVISQAIDIANDVHAIRVNASASGSSSGNLGTGNFGNYSLYLASRGGISIFANLRVYQFILVGKTASGTEVTDTETYINVKTAAY